MKKILLLFIALACVLSLAACGSRTERTQADIDRSVDTDMPSDSVYEMLEERASSSYKLGDVNKDNDITNTDILMLYRHIYNSTVYPLDDGTTPSPQTLGDVNKDGKISNRDILMYYKYIYDPDLYPLEEKTEEETTQPWMGPGIWM